MLSSVRICWRRWCYQVWGSVEDWVMLSSVRVCWWLGDVIKCQSLLKSGWCYQMWGSVEDWLMLWSVWVCCRLGDVIKSNLPFDVDHLYDIRQRLTGMWGGLVTLITSAAIIWKHQHKHISLVTWHIGKSQIHQQSNIMHHEDWSWYVMKSPENTMKSQLSTS